MAFLPSEMCLRNKINNFANSVREDRKYCITTRVCGQDLYPGQVQMLMNVIFLTRYFIIVGKFLERQRMLKM